MYDDDGFAVSSGDTVMFTYGIPPVRVNAKLVMRNGSLIALSKGHTPDRCYLRALRRYAGNWYKVQR